MSPSPLTIAEVIVSLRDYSGYVRQTAVERAAELADPAVLPLLVERLNDWVPNVRDAARIAVLELIPKVPAGAVIANLSAILALSQKSRSEHAPWLAQFESALLRYVAPGVILAAVKGSDFKAGRACFSLLNRRALFEQTSLIDLALSSRVDIVLAGTAANMIHHLPQSMRQDRYVAAASSRFGRVRTLGIQGLLRPPATHSKRELAFSYLLDSQTWVRQSAIAYLIAEQVDVKSYYRTQLADPALGDARRCIVLTALAGFRDLADLALVRPCAQHRVPAVRQAALYAWLKLAQKDKDEIAALAFSDHVAGVRKVALDLVRRRGAYIPFDSLQTDLLARQEWHMLLQYARFGQWNLLEAVARIAVAAETSSDAVIPDLKSELARWARCSSCFTRPTPAQAQFLSLEKTRQIFDALYDGSPSFSAILEREISIVSR